MQIYARCSCVPWLRLETLSHIAPCGPYLGSKFQCEEGLHYVTGFTQKQVLSINCTSSSTRAIMETNVQSRKGRSSGENMPAADLPLERYTYAAWASGPDFHWPPANRPASTPTARARYSCKIPFTFGASVRCDFETKVRAYCRDLTAPEPVCRNLLKVKLESSSLSVCAQHFSASSPPWSNLLPSSYPRSFQMKTAPPCRSWRYLAEGLRR